MDTLLAVVMNVEIAANTVRPAYHPHASSRDIKALQHRMPARHEPAEDNGSWFSHPPGVVRLLQLASIGTRLEQHRPGAQPQGFLAMMNNTQPFRLNSTLRICETAHQKRAGKYRDKACP